jgi:hypothetical protein
MQDDPRSGQPKTQRTDASMDLGALRLNIRCKVNKRRWLRESVQRKWPELWPDKWILHHDNAPEHALRVRKFLAKKSIKKWTIHLIHLTWPFVVIGSFQKICWHSWHPMQRDVTAWYFVKQFSRLFLAVAPSSHEAHTFTSNSSH